MGFYLSDQTLAPTRPAASPRRPMCRRKTAYTRLSRRGNKNQYVAFGNNPVNRRDPLGLAQDVVSVTLDTRTGKLRAGLSSDIPNTYKTWLPSMPYLANMDGERECPHRPLFGTFQVGFAMNGQAGVFNVNWNGGIAVDGQGGMGWYRTLGVGGGLGGGLSFSVSFAGSNGAGINDLAGPFAYGTGSLGAGLNGSVEGFGGVGSQNQPILGGGLSVGVGGGGGAAEGLSTTDIYPWF